MMTHGLLAFLVALLALAHVAPQRSLAQAVEAIEDPDVYDVYAAVLPSWLKSGNKTPTSIAVLQETRTGPTDCRSNERMPPEWHPVFASYWKENARVRLIQPAKDLGVPCVLVTWAALTELMLEAGYDLTKFSGQHSPGWPILREAQRR